MLAGYTPSRARFRTYLRTCLDRHVIDQHRRASSQARGGGQTPVPLDTVVAAAGDDPESLFEEQWLRHLMELAVSEVDRRLVETGKPVHAALFRAFHLDDKAPSYEQAAEAHGVSVSDVRNWLHAARREFRVVALELLADLTLDDDDFAAEAKAVFGIDVRAGR
jgi:DNA-directed RNA polymerase specialized sigma24 family protein